MNQRIRELLVKAGIEIKARRPYIDEDPDGYLESDNDFILNNHEAIIKLLEEGGLEKFAELMIEECVQSIENTIQTNCETDSEKMGCEFAITDLKQHFGVGQ